jgi:hypothetical protein
MPLLDHIRARNLRQLARRHYDPKLTEAEIKVLNDSASSAEPEAPKVNAQRLSIRSDFVRWLAIDPEAVSFIDPKGLRVYGITLGEALDLKKCRIDCSLDFSRCTFEKDIDLRQVNVRGISLKDSMVEGRFRADRIEAHGSILLLRSKFSGEVSFKGAQIGSNLSCAGSILSSQNGYTLIVDGARIGGNVFLRHQEETGTRGLQTVSSSSLNTEIKADAVDRKCFISMGTVRMPGVRIGKDLDCTGAKLQVENQEALIAEGAEIGGNVFLRGDFTSSGRIDLDNARIRGNLDCSGASLQVKRGDALSADCAEIGGNAFLREAFTSSGLINLRGARIMGDLNCSRAKLGGAGHDALNANRAEIGGNLFLREEFESSDGISLHSTKIGGQLSFAGAKVAEISCRNLRLSGDLAWVAIKVTDKTSLDLVGARIKRLRDDRESWPTEGKLDLDGLVYEEVTLNTRPSLEQIKERRWTGELPLDARERIKWIMLQKPERRSEPQPWMQLRELLEKKGDHKGAKYVLFRFNCLKAQKSWILWRWLKKYFAWLEEKPLRILWTIAGVVVLGTINFWVADSKQAMMETVRILPTAAVDENRCAQQNMSGQEDNNKHADWCRANPVSIHYPPFNPFVYSLENCLPIVKLGMDDRWMPSKDNKFTEPWFPNHPKFKRFNYYGFLVFCRWFLILFGWVQATVLVAALSHRFKD